MCSLLDLLNVNVYNLLVSDYSFIILYVFGSFKIILLLKGTRVSNIIAVRKCMLNFVHLCNVRMECSRRYCEEGIGEVPHTNQEGNSVQNANN